MSVNKLATIKWPLQYLLRQPVQDNNILRHDPRSYSCKRHSSYQRRNLANQQAVNLQTSTHVTTRLSWIDQQLENLCSHKSPEYITSRTLI